MRLSALGRKHNFLSCLRSQANETISLNEDLVLNFIIVIRELNTPNWPGQRLEAVQSRLKPCKFRLGMAFVKLSIGRSQLSSE